MDTPKTVLVVDDSRVSRMMSRAFILSKHPGWVVEEASSGEEGMEKAEKLSLALVLMDVNMPGMGGLAAAEKLRAQYPKLPIFLQTANIQDTTRNKAVSIEVGFLEKPITEARIHKMLDEMQR